MPVVISATVQRSGAMNNLKLRQDVIDELELAERDERGK